MAFTIICRNVYNSNKRILFNHNLCRIISSVNLSSDQNQIRKTESMLEAPTVISKLKLIQESKLSFGRQLIANFFNFVEEISHMDDVRKAQSKVIEIKDILRESGDKKRLILFELNLIRNDIQKNHSEICNATRGTERYLALVQDEMKLLKSEEKKQLEFSQIDEQERQQFNNMTTAINDSYEKEKIYSNFIKVLGLIGTLTASIVTLIASAIGHYYHNTKFGLVAKDFKDNVNKTITTEISNLKTCLRLDIATAMDRNEQLLKKLKIQEKKEFKLSSESWGTYFKRHGSNIYYFINPVSWGTYFKRHGSNIYYFIMRKPSS